MNNRIYSEKEKEQYFEDWKKEALFFYKNKMIDKDAIERINKLNFKDIKMKIDCDYLINAINRFRSYKSETPNCKCAPTQLQLNFKKKEAKINKKIKPDKETLKKLNDLARHKMKHKLLADIATDITICKLEKWDYKEYLQQLIQLLNGLLCSK